jgi:hypothetical protein
MLHTLSAFYLRKEPTGKPSKLEFNGDQREADPHFLLCWFFPPVPALLSRGPSFTQAGAVFSFPTSGAKRRLVEKPRHAMR